MSELKPCPFCGAMPETDGKLVQCYLMPCAFRRFKMPVEAWNTRPIEDALHARIAELEGLVDRLITISDWATIGMVISNSYSSSSGILKLAEDRRSEFKLLVKDWKEREE